MIIKIKIKPDDGLPTVICMRCLGTLEFLCDFHSMCHNTQNDLQLIAKLSVNKNKSNNQLESDAESDKENTLPNKYLKRREKPFISDKTKFTKFTENEEKYIENKIIEDLTEKNTNYLCLDAIIDKYSDTSRNDSLIITSYQSRNQNFEKEITSDVIHNKKDSQINKIIKLDDLVQKNASTNNVQRSNSIECENNERKTTRSKTFSLLASKNKIADSRQVNNSKKTIDKYFKSKFECKVRNENKQFVTIKDCALVSNFCSGEDTGKDVMIEGIVINRNRNKSSIMPSKESQDNSLRLDNIVKCNDNQVVQTQEVNWVQNNSNFPETVKSNTAKLNQSMNDGLYLENEAEKLKTGKTLNDLPSGQNVDLITSTEQLIVVEVQLPSKENTPILQNNADTFKRKRSLSTTTLEGKFSEGRFAKISELMTDKQKRDIESLYLIDMTLVDEFKVHKNIVTLDKCKFQCKICETIYPRFDKCQVHIWRHLDMKPYICKACDFSTLTISNIRCHIRKSHLKIKPFECHLCNKRYNSATLLEEHINIHTGSRPYRCNFCDFASTSKQVLAHHILIHKSKKDILCDICGKGFYSKGRMRAHQISHNKQQAFKCTLCSTYVLHEDALERHYLNIHTKDYICKICNKIYKSRKALHNHESVHSDAKFECPMCPNVYKSTHILKEHILKHQGIRQYKCNNCHKSFAQQSHLAAHMAVHSDITYNCPGCQKGFNRHDNMKVHAKRCDKFLKNPELQNLLIKRKINFSKNNTARVSAQKDDHVEMKNNQEKLMNNIKKTVDQLPTVKNSELNSNDMIIVENVLSSKEF